MSGGPCATRRLLVFLRRPRPGEVKTRLIPALGAAGAARLYARLAARALDAAAAVRIERLERIALVAPADGLDETRLLFGGPFTWRPQPDGDLGERLSRAFDEAFADGARHVVAIGSDCPGLGAPEITDAFRQLAHHDAVIGPALDGGYTLIGLSRPLPAIFERIPWSTPGTLASTRRRLRAHGACWFELPALRDIDTPDDLAALDPAW